MLIAHTPLVRRQKADKPGYRTNPQLLVHVGVVVPNYQIAV